jgi:hypothetical protein
MKKAGSRKFLTFGLFIIEELRIKVSTNKIKVGLQYV